jgi:hypothetical protein
VLAACALLLPSPSRAGYLPLTLDPSGPTTEAVFGSLFYTASSGDFNANGFLVTSLTQTGPKPTLNGFFTPSSSLTIDLTVDSNGNFVSNGLGFLLNGEVDFYDPTFTTIIESVGDSNNPLLLSGTFTNFGLAPGSPNNVPGGAPTTFDMLFRATGGLLTSQPLVENNGKPVYSVGQTLGVILVAEDATNGSLGDFKSDFSSDSVKADAGPPAVPAPPAAVLALIGSAVLLGRSALRRREAFARTSDR